MDFPADPAGLCERIADCRALREHHLWEAARAVAPVSGEPPPGRARLAELARAGALVEAALVLIGAAKPRRLVCGMRLSAGLWTCVVRGETGRARFTATHADLAAALLTAFLRSFATVRARRAVASLSHVQRVLSP